MDIAGNLITPEQASLTVDAGMHSTRAWHGITFPES